METRGTSVNSRFERLWSIQYIDIYLLVPG